MESAKQIWRDENYQLGKDCGFPECCVNEFCEDVPGFIKPTVYHRMRVEAAKINGKFTGFVPCKLHAAQIVKGMIKLTDLLNNRSKDLPPFPYYGNYER